MGFDDKEFPLALSGGLLIHHERYRAALGKELDQLGLHAAPMAIITDPVAGAVLLAQRSLESAVKVR